MLNRIISLLTAVFCFFFSFIFGHDGRQKYIGEYSPVNGALAGTDDLGREIPTDSFRLIQSGKTVGIFYFLWQGEHGTGGPYDNSKIVASDPSAILSHENWLAAGGGPVGAHHFWGEPMFGYYKSSDKWVLRKHAQMLSDAGIDYVIFDTTNAFTYTERVIDLIDVSYEMMLQGFKVPQLAFYTYTCSADTIARLYDEIYNNAQLYEKYPQLDKMWFRWDGKPLLIGSPDGLSDEIKEYFTIKLSQWPTEKKKLDAWPWIEFSRSLTQKAVYRDKLLRKTVISVSVAQHSDTVSFSNTAWYSGNDRTRSWHNGANDKSENAVLYGYNFAEQWEYALKQNTPTVFVTGWNEWVAQRGDDGNTEKPILFCDCADYNNSRDVEPMNELFGDNYYMQLAGYVNRYKGAENRVDVGEYVTVDIQGSFGQWNSDKITAVYTDYRNDTANRDCDGFGSLHYTNTTGRNDFTLMKTAHDEKNVYFYAETAAEIVGEPGDNRMILFINTNGGNPNWYGYDFAVNLQGDGVISRCNGGWNWSSTDNVEMRTQGNKMMLKVPYSVLGIDKYNDSLINLRFKWADNFQKNDSGEYDIFSFYKDGDAAPIGRFDYVYSDVK